MDKLLNGSTIYDVLSAIIPGYLICLLLKILLVPQEPVIRDMDSVSLTIIIFTTSYLVGLLLKVLTERLFSPLLRNNLCLIKKACWDAEIDEEEKKKLLEEEGNKEFKHTYFDMYYVAVNGNANSSISPLEVQVAFIRSMIVVILAYLVCYSKVAEYFGLGCVQTTIFINLLLLEFFICCLIFHLQYRLHRLVWEDSSYIKRTNKTLGNI